MSAKLKPKETAPVAETPETQSAGSTAAERVSGHLERLAFAGADEPKIPQPCMDGLYQDGRAFANQHIEANFPRRKMEDLSGQPFCAFPEGDATDAYAGLGAEKLRELADKKIIRTIRENGIEKILILDLRLLVPTHIPPYYRRA